MLPAIFFIFSRNGCDQAVQQCLAGLALYGKATGELKPDGQVVVQTVNVLQDPQMLAVMAVLDRILSPAQRVQLADALDGMGPGKQQLLASGGRMVASRAP